MISHSPQRTLQAGALAACAFFHGGCEKPATSGSDSRSGVPSTGNAWFKEVASERGINFTWKSGHESKHLMPECIGGGGALFDMDNDGDLDAYFVQAGSLTNPGANPPNELYRNDGKGHFEKVAEAGGANDPGYGMGVACGDYDNDGDVDLYITNVGQNVLYQNDGRGKFADVTAGAGTGHQGWSTSAAFLDYDNDGDLDLYVCNYINWSAKTEIDCFNDMSELDYCSPVNYQSPAMDTLYRNNGDGTFADVSVEAGLNAWFGNGLGLTTLDFNRDGFIDVFVANDGMRNQLWLNQKNGTFKDVALQVGCAMDQEGLAKAGMGIAAADLDDDADTDLLVGNLRRESDSLYINQGEFFLDGTAQAHLRTVSRPLTRFGIGFADFDNDGFLDLYEANGMVLRQDITHAADPYAEPNLLLRGRLDDRAQKTFRFEEVQPRGGVDQPLIATSRAAIFGDVDNDGGVDVLVVNRDGAAHLLRNEIATRADHRWVMLRIVDEHGRDAYGAVVQCRVGDRTITREMRAAYSFCASNDPRVHIGLGSAERIDDVTVTWPGGEKTSFGSLAAGQIHQLVRPK